MKIGDKEVAITKAEKVLFPKSGITKGEIVSYYQEVSVLMIKYAMNHPVTLHRFPNGIDQKEFMQKNVSEYFPKWIPTVKVEKQNGHVDMAMINNADTLAYLTNQGTITYHIWLSNQDSLHQPDRMIIDLDPSDDNFESVVSATKMVRKIYDELELPCFLMTTGSKGIHIVTPLAEKEDFEMVKQFTKTLCNYIAEKCPNETTIEIRKDKRKGRVFLDFLRNAYAQTGVAPYSTRPIEHAPVATPIFCEELDEQGMHSQRFNIKNILKRIDKKGDPWDGFDKQRFRIAQLSKKFEKVMDKDGGLLK